MTNETGVYTVEATKLNYNTIYEVKETETVAGYILDTTSHYIMCVKKEENGKYSDTVQAYIDYCTKQNMLSKYKVAYDLQSFNLEIYNAQKGIIVKIKTWQKHIMYSSWMTKANRSKLHKKQQ